LGDILPPELLSEYSEHVAAGKGHGVGSGGSNVRLKMEFSAVQVHFLASEADARYAERVQQGREQAALARAARGEEEPSKGKVTPKLSKAERRRARREYKERQKQKQKQEQEGSKHGRLLPLLRAQLAELQRRNKILSCRATSS
jgi:hypothetical protein